MRLIDADYVLSVLGIFNDRVNGNKHFLNGIETAKEIVANAPTVGEWINVNDKLPEELQDVLLLFPSNMAVGYYIAGGWLIYSGGGWTTDIAEDEEVPQYWLPLVGAPKKVVK